MRGIILYIITKLLNYEVSFFSFNFVFTVTAGKTLVAGVEFGGWGEGGLFEPDGVCDGRDSNFIDSNGNYKSEIRHQISDIKTPLCFYLIYDFLYLIYYLAITTAVAGGVLGGEVLGNSAGGVGDCKVSGFRFQI